jgi:hypothetical protein
MGLISSDLRTAFAKTSTRLQNNSPINSLASCSAMLISEASDYMLQGCSLRFELSFTSISKPMRAFSAVVPEVPDEVVGARTKLNRLMSEPTCGQ